jgi:peptide-methionine (R)-S-oxide reductase
MNRREFLKSSTLFGALLAVGGLSLTALGQTADLPFKKIVKTNEEWKKILTADQYHITREAGTEAPYTSPLTDLKSQGTFTCVCCNLPLFSSKNKFDSGTGWASFYAPINKTNVLEKVDNSLSETRTEVLCNRCDAHLGHVFDDGPKPTGLRYCMNGVALKFVKNKSKKA